MRTNCNDCRISVKTADAYQRSISLKRVVLCKPCAEDRGWIDIDRPVLQVVR
jgi:hypothetical protein